MLWSVRCVVECTLCCGVYVVLWGVRCVECMLCCGVYAVLWSVCCVVECMLCCGVYVMLWGVCCVVECKFLLTPEVFKSVPLIDCIYKYDII